MESIESPLDVLSRAATMIQDSLPINNDESSKQAATKQLPTTKWKRDRRRLPEYSRKSDPKLAENTPPELLLHSPGSPVDTSNKPFAATNGVTDAKDTNAKPAKQNVSPNVDAPIDMSVRQRGLPPSYSQAINSPGYRTGYRPSVITQAPSTPPDIRMASRNDLPSGISMCDPIIDEHFRRSLGKDYLMLFSNNNKNAEPVTLKKESVSPTTVRELIDIDTASLSVDDHFAKALGDTWIKLNQKDSDLKTSNGTAEKHTVVSL